MMEYKRFVSYLYRYEGGQRERNAGFVRLEVRNSQCRIRIFLHHLPEMQTEGEAWMFRQDGEHFRMVPLGRFTVREGGVEVCLATRADSFLDTGLPVTAFRGLAVFLGTEERLYLTVWDDDPVDFAAIRRRGEEPKEEPEMEKTEERGDLGETGTSFEVPSGKESISVDADASPAKEGSTVDKDEPSAEKEGILIEKKEPFAEKEGIRIEKNEPSAEKEQNLVEKAELSAEKKGPARTEEGYAIQEATPADYQRQSIERDFRIWWRQLLEAGAAVVEKYVGLRQAKLETAEIATEKQENSGEISFGASLPEPSRELSFDASLPDPSPPDWAALCRQLPHFLPEGQTEQREFLRLSLQDIGRLPRVYWDFGKNAFVLYGFSLGGHLILMREKPSA
ncbi:MAG: hypothetical protein LUC27_00250, partial [Lachnospiraceae bacterium]|nr:hypothetical protein [Lachnospiraceae bacterium]